MDKKVRKEASSLVREVRRAIKRSPDRVPESLRDKLLAQAKDLDATLQAEDPEAGDDAKIRAQMVALDGLAEEHLTFARKSTFREYAESISIAVMIALFLRAFVVEAFKIPSGSMIPTMQIGDHIFVNKFIYGIRVPFTTTKFFDFRKPRRGEVIVFINPCQTDKDFIKRIVGLAGDTVEVRCNIVYVNGKAVPFKLVKSHERHRGDGVNEGTIEEKLASRYRETLGDVEFDAYHAQERPRMDAQQALGGSYWDHSDLHDFPKLQPSEDQPESEKVLRRVAKEKGIQVSEDVIKYIASARPQHLEDRDPKGADYRGGVEFLTKALELLHKASKERPLDVSLARDVVAPGIPSCDPETQGLSKGRINEMDIRVRTLGHLGVPEEVSKKPCAPRLHYIVPKGHVFVMGDNRQNSADSRMWGSVPLDNLKGKALFIWWSSTGGWRDATVDRLGKLVH